MRDIQGERGEKRSQRQRGKKGGRERGRKEEREGNGRRGEGRDGDKPINKWRVRERDTPTPQAQHHPAAGTTPKALALWERRQLLN